jgi:4-hydroxy-tetrahydrodipicolinate synthase
MESPRSIQGVFAAIVTPIKSDFSPDMDGLPDLVEFLANRGCHGLLVLGTTGEGPSFSIEERLLVYESASLARQYFPDLLLLAGTGTPSLEDTIHLTKSVFNLGFDGVVVLPPYYFRKATDDGLFAWYSQVIQKSVPLDGALFGYHIPPISGVGLSLELLSRLKDTFPDQFKGIKDSSADVDWAHALGSRFGDDLVVLTGNDRLFSEALNSHASGCITAMANILSPLHRLVWDSFQTGSVDNISQEKLNQARAVLDRHPPMPTILKLLLSQIYGFPSWKVKPPLMQFDSMLEEIVHAEYLAALG